MSNFTADEVAYLQSQRLGRLATVSRSGDLHVVPLAFRYNPEHDSIDIGGHGFTKSKKYRDALRHGRVAFVVDDATSSGQPRLLEVRGTVEALSTGGEQISPTFPPEIIRISPTYIVSLGLDNQVVQPAHGDVHFNGRRVT
ncbi:MAG TPA: PPOX class F420-dependent oxidoreductase [Nitrolancea sp.]|nr:PPOX class F420-dependent oxidoreductase [Nitrolancea sp.]